MGKGHIVAMGGGGFSEEGGRSLLDDFLLELAGTARPRVCFVGTASGDADGYGLKFFEAFSRRDCVASRLLLFNRGGTPVAELLAEQDVIYVGGGSTANMLAVWRLHGVDVLLRQAWDRGAVLGGLSAGAICWFEAGVTDSFGADDLRPLTGCLELLPGSFCPHYDSEPRRAPTFRRLVAARRLPPGYGVDDGAAVHFAGTERVEVVSSRPSARAY
ncbi:MAG: peptidase E, partial [Actinomycetota bacterium]|nr:peptidase E [Actinomycetota bacterium]